MFILNTNGKVSSEQQTAQIDQYLKRGEPQKRIPALIDEKEWESLSMYLRTTEGQAEAKDLSTERFTMEWTILHQLCWNGAPLSVVRHFTEPFPSLAKDLDAFDRTPLHLLMHSSAGVDVSVVTHLLGKNAAALVAKDDRGRTPLISLIESIGKGDGLDEAKLENRHKVIKVLLAVRPVAILEEDDEGMSAIEHALCSNAPRKIIRSLQRVTMTEARNRRKRERFAAAKTA